VYLFCDNDGGANSAIRVVSRLDSAEVASCTSIPRRRRRDTRHPNDCRSSLTALQWRVGKRLRYA